MASSLHPHPVNAPGVERARDAAISEQDAARLSQLLTLVADLVRVRMLFALVAVDELCVGDLAQTLDISMDQSSYALKMLRAAGLVESRRDGRVIYYRLADGFPHQLLEHCLTQLLSITRGGTQP